MKVQINERVGWTIVTIILVISILMGTLGILHLNPNDLYFTYSSILQGFAAFLTFSIIVLYNELRIRDELIKEVENRVFNFINSTIGWLFFIWDKTIEDVINKDIEKTGFTNKYFIKQLTSKIEVMEFRTRETGLTFHLSPDSLIRWNKFGKEIDDEGTRKKMRHHEFTDIVGDFQRINNVVKECKEDSITQQERLKDAIKE